MKKVLLSLMCLGAMMAVSMGLKAQEVTITLNPGWTWISYLGTDTVNFATAMGSFTPAVGDVIKSQRGTSNYMSNGQWRGSLSQFYPGHGYMYKSNRTESVTLTFTMQQPVSQVMVTTSEPTDITSSSVVVGGIITLDEGNHVYASGVCWDTMQMPTVDDNHTTDGTGSGDFTTTLIALTPSTVYYVRAYVVTDYGLVYGEELSFTTLDSSSSNVPEGAIDGLFSVSASQQVYFSKGNLQYQHQDTVGIWRFAENQYDFIGNANSHISQSYSGWIDLFGWGTSGYNHGGNCYQPWSTSSNYADYYAYGVWNKNLSDENGTADWGCNAISNGGNQENQWRTLSQAEWNYVLFGRNTTSGIRFAKATIREQVIDTILNDTVFNDVHGIVLLPDNWSESAYILNDANESGAPYETNLILDNMWQYIETVGAVFLPAAGDRNGFSNILYPNSMGYYWSTTYDDNRYAYFLSFSDHSVYSNDSFYRFFGRSVRLVSNAE